MDKLERFIMPMILIIGISAILLARADADHVVVLARVVGIILGIIMGGAFFFRLLGMFIQYFRAKKVLDETQKEIARLRVLAEQEEAEAQQP